MSRSHLYQTFFEHCNESEISAEAKNVITQQFEMTLRIIMQKSKFYSQMFKRRKLMIKKQKVNHVKKDDIVLALNEYKSLQNIRLGIKNGESNNYYKVANFWLQRQEYQSLDLQLKESIKFLKKTKKPGQLIKMDWMIIDGEIPSTSHEFRKVQEVQAIEKATTHIEIEKKIQCQISFQMYSKLKYQKNLIEQETDQKFYKSSPQLKDMLKYLKQYPGLQNLLPFIIQNISSQDKNTLTFNGNLKQITIINVLEMLCQNPSINLEFHLHIILKMLISKITLKQVSKNKNSILLFKFKQKCANALFQVIVKHEDKYLEMKNEVIDLLQNVCNKFPYQYSTIYGIFKFFERVNNQITRYFIIEKLSFYLSSQKFEKDLHQHNNNCEAFQLFDCFIEMVQRLISNLKFITINQTNEANFIYEKLFETFGEIILPGSIANLINLKTFVTKNDVQHNELVKNSGMYFI